jgi:iron complex outermembrane recepter protein
MSRRPVRAAGPAAFLSVLLAPRSLRPTAIAAAVHLTVCGGLLVAMHPFAHAQGSATSTQPASSAVVRSYDIPAGPLDEALTRLVKESGALLAATPQLVQGKTSPGVRGMFSARAALDALLGGTGLRAESNAQGQFVLRQVDINTLAEVTVTDRAGYDAPIKVDQASVTRSGASILDTPQTVSVIPVQTTQDQAAQTIGDVVRNTAGARPQSYFGTYESVYARGFWMTTTSNWTRNGFRWIHLSQPSKRNVDRYEMIKGPVGLDYGRVEPGALMNIVTKKPLESTYREITMGLSEGDGWDLGFDVTGPLNEAGTVLYRLNGGRSRQAFVAEEVKPLQEDLAGALTFKLSQDTSVDLDFEWTERNQRIYPGLPLPDPDDPRSSDRVRLSNFYGEPSGTFEGWHRAVTAQLQHRFDDQWSGRVGYSRNVMFRDVKQVRITGVSGDTVNRAANPFSQRFEVGTWVGELKGDLRLAGMRHRLTFTADRVGIERIGSTNNFGSVAPTSLRDPQPTGATFTYGPKSKSHVTDTGYAVQDYIEITPRWNALVGVRHSKYREENPGTADQTGSSNDPTVALIFKPEPWASIYASYARSFSPNSGTRTGPDTYAPPSRGNQVELGVKSELFGGRLRTSASIYELKKTNVPTPSLTDPMFSEVTGEQRSRGFELEVVGQITSAWSVLASYGYTDAEVTRSNRPEDVGKTPTFTPKNTASVWTTYRLDGAARGWTVGGGAFYSGGKYAALNNRLKSPAYTTVDLMASYEFASGLPGTKLQFNLRNVFDKRHYESPGFGYTSQTPGLPRTFSASLTVPF